MTGRPVVRVTGAAELDRKLDRLADDLDDWTGTNRDAAEVVVRHARMLAPVRTGRTRASIRTTTVTPTTATIATGTRYAKWADREHPFWRKAFRAARREITDLYREQLRRSLRR